MAADLSDVHTPAQFMTALRNYRALRGKPGFRLMAERCKQAKTATPIREALVSDDLPHPGTLAAILEGLQAGPRDRDAFTAAWHRLAASLAAVPTGGRP